MHKLHTLQLLYSLMIYKGVQFEAVELLVIVVSMLNSHRRPECNVCTWEKPAQ
jgi:hypothetical protein